MRKLVATFLCGFLIWAMPPAVAAQAMPQLFSTPAQAQQHCPADIVVWLNIPSGIYHFAGQRWYGRTKSGAFVCKGEADRAGDRPSLNGQ